MHPYMRVHTHTYTRIHKENSFEIFLAAGSDFQTETSQECGAKCLSLSSLLFPPPLGGGKLSKKHFSLGNGVLCPCEKAL